MLKILPETILKYLIDKLPPFTGILMIKTSDEGIISGWYGNYNDYLEREPAVGEDVCDLVPALFGMVPPLVVPAVLNRIQTYGHCIADIHVVQDEENGDFWIFFVDQTKEVESIRQLLQRVNENQLKEQAKDREPFYRNPFSGMHLLDYIAFKKLDDDYFLLVAEIPGWFNDLDVNLPLLTDRVALADYFPFIDAFVIEAAEFWNGAKSGNLKSGIWTETTREGKPMYLNAFAINLEDSPYLLIKPMFEEFDTEQDLMQRARDQSLAFDKLAKAERKLKELLDYKEKFVSIVSHDLRSPVASVLSIAQLLNTDTNFLSHLSDFNREMIKNIQDEMVRLLDYNDKLYHWSNLELGNFELVKLFSNLEDLVKTAVRTAKPKLDEKHIVFTTKVDSLLTVEVDNTLFLQVLNNLIGNAVKFTPDGGSIDIGASKVDGYIELVVRDSGIGMPKEVQRGLFQGFTVQSTQGTHGEKGTGLGLGIVKKIADAHQINIQVESSPGMGTAFILQIPTE